MRKTLLLLLLCFSCVFLLSCKEERPPATTADSNAITDTSALEDEALGVPATADFGGEEFNILSAGNIAYEDFTVEESSSMPLDNAQYKRKTLVEQNYNITITEETEKAYSSGNGPGYQAFYKAATAGTTDYDLGLIAGYDVSVLAYNGYLYDLGSVPGIDLTKSWWDRKANEALTIHGLTFFSVGDITCSDNDAAYVIMFNKKLLEDYNLSSPYDMVYDNQWTLANFAKLCKTVTEDLDQNGVMDENDRFGLLVWVDSLLGMVNAAGQRCCVINDNEQIVLSLYNETTVSAVDQYLAFALDHQYALQYQSIHNTVEFEEQLWSGEHGLFWTTHMGVIPRFREMESDFGLLPYPKLTETQDSYYSTVTPFNSQFICVPLVQEDVERTGIITEALAYHGQKIVLPAYYDVNLKGMVSRDEESSDMLDIIFDNLVYDLGFLYQIGPYNKNFNYMVSRRQTNFTSVYESLKPVAEMQLTLINNGYTNAAAMWAE